MSPTDCLETGGRNGNNDFTSSEKNMLSNAKQKLKKSDKPPLRMSSIQDHLGS